MLNKNCVHGLFATGCLYIHTTTTTTNTNTKHNYTAKCRLCWLNAFNYDDDTGRATALSGAELVGSRQKALLKAAAYGRAFCGPSFPPHALSVTAHTLRLLAATRDPRVGLPLTTHQLQALGIPALLARWAAVITMGGCRESVGGSGWKRTFFPVGTCAHYLPLLSQRALPISHEGLLPPLSRRVMTHRCVCIIALTTLIGTTCSRSCRHNRMSPGQTRYPLLLFSFGLSV
jgi:hypothetical protein